MSDYKINQNMEFGDIIYFIILIFFVILGIFNDSRKKKQQNQTNAEPRSFMDEKEEEGEEEFIPRQPQKRERDAVIPPVPVTYSAKDIYKNFQSSLDLVSIHDDQPVPSSYTFDYDANSFYERDMDSLDVTESMREEMRKSSVHPFIKELKASREELKKGLIYGEIMQRKY